jgi:hypothetical protein
MGNNLSLNRSQPAVLLLPVWVIGFTTAIPEETSWTKSTPKDEKRTYFQDSHRYSTGCKWGIGYNIDVFGPNN